ncbi:MAG TPA: hypothetical protein VHB98_07615 [Chloroflexota bacterium]|nr:hypothetical protein [Chloroflexota bacterium]
MNARWSECHDHLYSRAHQLAAREATQEQIAVALEREFPGLQQRQYLNPAAVAAMQHVRQEEDRRQGRRRDRAGLRARGLPEHWADRQQSGQADRSAAAPHPTVPDEY